MKHTFSRFGAASALVIAATALFAGSALAQTAGPGGMMGSGYPGNAASGTGPGNMVGGAPTGHQFMMGFGTMASMMGGIVGQPLQDEWHSANGDGIQMTTTGMMVWRKADNWTAFTNGYMTWVNGPYGIQQRLNTERFPWETR